MADSGLVAFGAAVAGALVGGVGSAVGSAWVQRREVVRGARLRMYDELLPPLREKAKKQMLAWDIARDLHALWRAAVIAGRVERKLVTVARNASAQQVRALEETKGTDVYGNEVYGGARADAETQHLCEVLNRLNSHLEHKIL